jgi:hypothetical protein
LSAALSEVQDQEWAVPIGPNALGQ